jgi:hypothetical protein
MGDSVCSPQHPAGTWWLAIHCTPEAFSSPGAAAGRPIIGCLFGRSGWRRRQLVCGLAHPPTQPPTCPRTPQWPEDPAHQPHSAADRCAAIRAWLNAWNSRHSGDALAGEPPGRQSIDAACDRSFVARSRSGRLLSSTVVPVQPGRCCCRGRRLRSACCKQPSAPSWLDCC